MNDLMLCVLAKNSEGQILRWFDSQCIALSIKDDFELYQAKSNKGAGLMQGQAKSYSEIKIQSNYIFLSLFTVLFLTKML
jgi:hypothetical protein